MGLFDFLRTPDIDQGVRDCAATAGGVLVDVRTEEEYDTGHIPGSRNVPLDVIGREAGTLGTRETPLFLYCASGARSGQAAAILHRMGYTNVKNIGGIHSYTGKVVLT